MEYYNYPADKQIENYCYSFQAVLGQGSSGTVYLGKNMLTNKKVAIKVIDKNTLKNEYYYQLLSQEINIMKNIESPNIVRLLDVYQTIKNTYIVTEYCNEGDLRQQICSAKQPISESQAIKIIKNLLEGVNALFQVNILHRDLKPANILINDGVYKITDFGFAKRVPQIENQMMTSLVGTPLYMCPQILMRQSYSSKCDVWSIGVIFFELLNGYAPWSALNVIDLLNNILQHPQINFSCNASEIVQHFIKKCLTIKEEDRYSLQEVFEHPLFNISIGDRQITKKRSTTINNMQQTLPTQRQSQRSIEQSKKQRYSTPNKSQNTNLLVNKVINQNQQQIAQKFLSENGKTNPNNNNFHNNQSQKTITQYKKTLLIDPLIKYKENEDLKEEENKIFQLKNLLSPKEKQITLNGINSTSNTIIMKNLENKLGFLHTKESINNSNKENANDTLTLAKNNSDKEKESLLQTEQVNTMIEFINFIKGIIQIIKSNSYVFNDFSQFLVEKVVFILQKHTLIKINILKNNIFDKDDRFYTYNLINDIKYDDQYVIQRDKVNKLFYEILKSFQICWIQLHEIDGFFDDCLKDQQFQQIFNSDYEEKMKFYNNSQNFIKMFIREANHKINQKVKMLINKQNELSAEEGILIQCINNVIDYFQLTEINLMSQENFIKIYQTFNFDKMNLEQQYSMDYQFYKKIRQRIYEYNI